MYLIGPLAVIVASLVALSSFIIAKKPSAKDLFDKIQPYQGFLGVGLLAWGIYDLYHYVLTSYWGDKSWFGMLLEVDKPAGFALLGYIVSEILLGFMLGFGLIATWIPGEGGAEKKALSVQKKLLGASLPIGIIGLVCAVFWLIKYKG